MQFRKKIFWLSFVFLLTVCDLSAQSSETDTTKHKMFNWFAYPFAFYTPEINFAAGGGGIMYFRTSHLKNTRPSKISGSAYYSLNHQYLIYLNPSVFFNQNKDELTAEIFFENRLDEFYGIGNTTDEIKDPEYSYSDFSINAKFRRQVFGQFRIILAYEFMNYRIKDFKQNPFLNDDYVYGEEGGITSGLGFGVNYDDRDNVFFPENGSFIDIYSLFFVPELGSNYDFHRYIFDFRHYLSLSKDDNIIAVQGYGEFVRGNTPFYLLPKLGGQHRMRGYYEGRYRGEKYITVQAEYRKSFFGDFDFVLFFGVGDVANDFDDFQLDLLKYSYGGGLRYIIDKDEKLNIRVDIGFGNDTMGFYFGVEEAF